mgnify:CR=1 FL=1
MTRNQLTPQEKWQKFREKGKVVYVDFDGTLCRFSYPDLGPPLPGARKFMKALVSRDLQPVILTSRCSPEVYTEEERAASIEKVARWLHKYNIPYHAIDSGNNGKPIGLAYVDDRGVHADGRFEVMLRKVLQIKEREKERFDES